MFNISKLVNKITDRGTGSGEPARSGSHVVQNTEEQHSEGFLCPQCMRAFASKEVLETHYNDTHTQSDYVSISGSEDTSNNVGDDDVEILREQLQTLQLCLAEEKLTSEDLKNEILKLQANYQLVGDSQGKQFENDRALLNSEVALLRKQLTDSLEHISTNKKDMEKVISKNEALQTEIMSLKSTIGSLETQLTHKNSLDDATVLKQELVSVQKMMDKLSLEKDKQIEELNGKIQILEKSDVSKELQLKLSKAEESMNSLTKTIEKQQLVTEKLVIEHQKELKQSSQKLLEVNSQLSDVSHRKADLESQCTTLTEGLKRLNDQHAELYRKFEGGEGASAALAALQLENEQLKENSTRLNQKISELSATLQQMEKAMETETLNLKSTIDGLNKQLSASTENIKALNSKNLELTGNVAELNKQAESKKEELESLVQSFAAEQKAMETDTLNLKSTIDDLNKELSASTENIKALKAKNLELTGNVAELLEQVETKKGELESRIQSFEAERKELEVRLAQSDDAGKEKDESISKLKIEFDNLYKEFQQKDTEFSRSQEKYATEIATEQLACKSLMDVKENQAKEIEELKAENVSLSNKILDVSKTVEVLTSSENNLRTELEQKSHHYTEASEKLDNAQKAKQTLEEKLLELTTETSAIHATHTTLVTELKAQLIQIEEQSRSKMKELENIINISEKETNQLKENLQKLSEEKTEITERMKAMESQTEVINTKFKEMESEHKLLQDQKDSASKDKIEFEKRLRTIEDEKTLLLEKCLSSETEFEQQQQKIIGMQRKLDDSYAALQELGRENQSLQMESAKLQGRKWADDSLVTNCCSCGKDFSLTIRKHHCRNCGLIYCDGCSSRTASVPSCKKPARVCDPCYSDLNKKLNN